MRHSGLSSHQRRWVLYLVASVFIHLIWFLYPDLRARISDHTHRRNNKEHLAKPSNSKNFFKLQIYTNHETPSDTKSLSSKKYRQNLSRPPRNYYDLLPRNLTVMNDGETSTLNESPTNHESAARAFVQSARSSQHVREFAAELRGRLTVPDKIYRLRRTGNARALMKKISDGQWKVDIFGIDAYARSILLEAISTIPENSPGFLKLNQSDWRRLEIGFSFEWRNNDVGQPQQEESDVSISENQITIAVIHRGSELELNKNLRRAMVALPLTAGIVDIAGIYKEYLKTKEPAAEFDRGIRRLERSPAFMRSLITVPLGK